MAEKPLNAYEIALLESSPHVVEVEKNKIYFTPEFKKVMYGGLVSGKPLRKILEENGIPPKILGQNRLHNIAAALRRNGTREEGFVDLRGKNSRKPAQETKEKTLAARVEQLEHKLAYANQQIEFLKKIHLADLEARKLWESKQKQKQNSK